MIKQQRFATAQAVLFTTLVTSLAQGQILIDDFNDSDADGWTPRLSGEGTSWGPGVFDATTGAYILSTTGEVEAFTFSAISATWDVSENPVYSNGTLRATIREIAGGTNLGVGLRVDDTGESGYFVTTTYEPRGLQIVGCTPICVIYASVPVHFEAGEDGSSRRAR